ncbi:MAG: hypothetical protein AB1642_09860 [Pseudomonadota bacterium]
MNLIDFLTGFFGGGIAAGLVGFLARDWLALRIKTAIESEVFVQHAAFDIKRLACLEALAVVDAAFSQREWKQSEAPILVAKQPLDIAAARRAYNQLALTCTDSSALDLYARALGLREPDEPPIQGSADLIVDLRNAMRHELGFGTDLNLSRSKAWIASLDGAT